MLQFGQLPILGELGTFRQLMLVGSKASSGFPESCTGLMIHGLHIVGARLCGCSSQQSGLVSGMQVSVHVFLQPCSRVFEINLTIRSMSSVFNHHCELSS